MTPINFPHLGNSLVMAVVILTHVFFAVAAPAGIPAARPTARTLLQKHGCLACHKYEKEGGTFGPALDAHLKHHSRDELKKILKNPPQGMPPFRGSDKELSEFVTSLAGGM